VNLSYDIAVGHRLVFTLCIRTSCGMGLSIVWLMELMVRSYWRHRYSAISIFITSPLRVVWSFHSNKESITGYEVPCNASGVVSDTAAGVYLISNHDGWRNQSDAVSSGTLSSFHQVKFSYRKFIPIQKSTALPKL